MCGKRELQQPLHQLAGDVQRGHSSDLGRQINDVSVTETVLFCLCENLELNLNNLKNYKQFKIHLFNYVI